MREIKFRGKTASLCVVTRIDNNQWVYGDLIQHRDGKKSICEQPASYGYGATEEVSHEVCPQTVGQYTGLKDENGVEIYEGDILSIVDPNGEAEERTCIVEYDEKDTCYSYESECGFDGFDITSIGWAKEMGFRFTIIGNIYEHPELL